MNKILIANRGEIACRIIRTAQKMGVVTVAIYSPADADSLHVRLADEAWCLESNELSESYLNVEKILNIALKSKADGIHPGYGFLSENPALVKGCETNGITFVGPSLEPISKMGNKIEARAIVRELGVPMTQGAVGTADEIVEKSQSIPLPLLVKAAAGGGGKGMRIVREREKLRETIEATSREAKAYFGDGQVYVEQYIEDPRHIEIQVLGDKFGNVIHLFERECSLQRRYQKIIEESPSPTLSQKVRLKMGEAAVAIAASIGYDSAGTIEFLVDKNLDFYFLEMNTRIQVEHPVTEMVTGVDIVEEQIHIARSEKLRLQQSDITQTGHAIEARVYAEDPENEFMPAPGKIFYYQQPTGKYVRVDAAIDQPATIHSFYDPMISKLIAWGENRQTARLRLIEALEHYPIIGIKTNTEYLHFLLNHSDFIQNKISTKYCDVHLSESVETIQNERNAANNILIASAFLIYHLETVREFSSGENIWNYSGFWRFQQSVDVVLNEKTYAFNFTKTNNLYHLQTGSETLEFNLLTIDNNSLLLKQGGRQMKFYIATDGHTTHWINFQGKTFDIRRSDELFKDEFYVDVEAAGEDAIKSPMPGKVIKVAVKQGDTVSKGDLLLILEAMKMENSIIAHRDAEIEELFVSEGEMVENGKLLLKLKEG